MSIVDVYIKEYTWIWFHKIGTLHVLGRRRYQQQQQRLFPSDRNSPMGSLVTGFGDIIIIIIITSMYYGFLVNTEHFLYIDFKKNNIDPALKKANANNKYFTNRC